jgi:hypothetical protein
MFGAIQASLRGIGLDDSTRALDDQTSHPTNLLCCDTRHVCNEANGLLISILHYTCPKPCCLDVPGVILTTSNLL